MGHRDRKNPLLDQIRRMATHQQLRQMPDRELLTQFAGQGNEAAFRTLLDRYGPMVLRVCKRILGNDHDAEDAYQATFLVLTSEAGSHSWQESVAPWLHSVAVRVAGNARRAAQRRRVHEHQAVERKSSDPVTDVTMREAYGLLEEEIARLPDKYRVPLIQCELMGRHQDEVRRELGCSLRTLTLRLEQGKKLLRKRLTAQGVTMTGLMLSLMLSSASEAAVVPPTVSADTLRAALLFLSGREAVAASPAANHLAGMVIKGMVVAQMRSRVLWGALILALAGGGAGAWQAFAHRPNPANPPSGLLQTNERPAARDAVPVARGKVAEPEVEVQADGPTSLVRGKVLDAAGRAIPFAAVTALARRPFRPGEQALRDAVVAGGHADEKGVFRLRVPADFPTWFPERQVVLVAKAPGRAPLTTLVHLVEQGATEVDLRLKAAEGVVRGRLLDPDGAAASGVRLRVIRLGDVARETVQGTTKRDGQGLGWPGPVVSDAEGRFTLSGIDAEQGVWLQVEDDRYAPDAIGLRGTDKAAEVRLKPARVLEGRIVAADTGKAVAGVKLNARLASQDLMRGRYMVSDYLSVSARVFPPASLDAVSGVDGHFRLRVPAGSPVHGREDYKALREGEGRWRLRPLAVSKTILEVHPPAESPYLAVCKEVSWSEAARQTLAVTLPRGVVVRGQVVDEDGRPVAGASVQFFSPVEGNPAYRPEVLQSYYRIVRTGKDGRFRLTAPAGPVQLQVHGPTHEYRVQALRWWSKSARQNKEEPERWSWGEPLPRRFYAHAQKDLKLTLAEDPPEVRLRLVRGETVAGRVIGLDGEPIKTAVLLCDEKVSPLRNGTVLPLPVHEGRYELPGCAPGRVYPVLIFDAVNGWGAAVYLRPGRGAGPEVELAPCGSARVRLRDGKGRPLAGRGPRLVVVTERSFPAGQPPRELDAEGHYSECYDPRHYSTDPVSDREGWLTLPALIPGVRYLLEWADGEGVLRQTRTFRVEPGEQLQLPDLTIRDRE